MHLHSSSNSNIEGYVLLLAFILYVSLLLLAIFSCVYFARKLVIFHFDSQLSLQRPLSSFTGIHVCLGRTYNFVSINQYYTKLGLLSTH